MTRRKTQSYFPPDEKPALTAECTRRVQFDEVDSLRIVWHGHYARFFEYGRGEWGRKFGFTYHDMADNGFAFPIVQMHIDYYYPLRYDELMRIVVNAHWTEATKLNTSYEIYAENGELAARGYTVQLCTDLEGRPMLLRPDFAERFFQDWDRKAKL